MQGGHAKHRSGRRTNEDGEEISPSYVRLLSPDGRSTNTTSNFRSQSASVRVVSRNDPAAAAAAVAGVSSPPSRRRGGILSVVVVLALLLLVFHGAFQTTMLKSSKSSAARSRSRWKRSGSFLRPGSADLAGAQHHHTDIDYGGEDDFNVGDIVDEGGGSVPRLDLPRWVRRPKEEGVPRILLVSDSWLSCNSNDVVGPSPTLRRQITENRLFYARRRDGDAMEVWISLDPLIDGSKTSSSSSSSVAAAADHNNKAAVASAAATTTDIPSWNGVVVISNLLRTHVDYDWFLYVAPDVLLLDLDFVIPWERYAGRDLVLWGSQADLARSADDGYVGGSAAPVEPRVMLVRPSAWSVAFMRRMMEIGGIERAQADGDEVRRRKRQKFLKSMVQRQPMMNEWNKGGGGGEGGVEGDVKVTPRVVLTYLLKTGDGVEDVHRKVHFENSYHLSGCWEAVVPKLEMYKRNWKGDGVEPPFAVTFEGCDLFCGGDDGDVIHHRPRPHEPSFNACWNAFVQARAFALNQTKSVMTAKATRRRGVPPASGSAAEARLACENQRDVPL